MHVLFFFFFFFNDTATTEIYTLSLHDALPISFGLAPMRNSVSPKTVASSVAYGSNCAFRWRSTKDSMSTTGLSRQGRSEEHTSEIQSHSDLVCRLLPEKKKTRVTARNLHTVVT